MWLATLIVERTQARAKYGNRHMTGFVLSHVMKKGIDPPMRKTRLSIISETGSGAPDRQFDKKPSDSTLRNLPFVTK